ncbi:MAG: DUF952 domain-containing protein [Chloroflexi bacterium]|nr:DUF952 domain-containing protein [Chloroflexota bacterium]
MNGPILHIAHRSAWQAALRAGVYAPESLAVEGFIHCSEPSQALRVANAFYKGRSGLALLVIDPGRLSADLRWEAGSDKPDELFPHIHGPLDLEAVMKVVEFEPGSDGSWSSIPL